MRVVSRPVNLTAGGPKGKDWGRCRGDSKEWTVAQSRLGQRQINERVIKLGDEKVEIKPSLAYAVSQQNSLCVISRKEDLARSGGAGAR